MGNSEFFTHLVKRMLPVRVFAISVIAVFFVEITAMLIINQLGSLPYAWQTLLDATIMVVLIFPLLYLLSYKPLLTNIADRERAEVELRGLQAGLEQRSRELARTNEELNAEIAERMHTEAQLHLQSAALEAAANGIIITGRRGNIYWANPALSRMTGYSLEEVLGQKPSGLQTKRPL